MNVNIYKFALLAAIMLYITASAYSQDTGSNQPILERTKIKKIYIIQFVHTDIGSTHPPREVSEITAQAIDNAVKFCDEDPDFKWTIEGQHQLDQWLMRKTPKEIDHFAELVKKGRISLSACYAGMHSGLMGAEEVCRFVYPAESFRQKYDLQMVTAMQNDVAGFTWAYPQVLKKSGIKYFVVGPNGFIGIGATIPAKDRPFYWEGPDGSRILTYMCSDSAGLSGYVMATLYLDWKAGGKAEKTVPEMLERLEASGYPYDAVMVMASSGDSILPDLEIAEGAREWNAKHESPKMILATPEEFFDHIISKYGDDFPVYRGDWAGLWEQATINLTYSMGLIRDVHNNLPVAEALASFAEVANHLPYPKKDLDSAWINTFDLDEHSSAGGVYPGLTKAQAAEEAATFMDCVTSAHETTKTVLDKSIATLASSVRADGNGVFVWNPLTSKNSGMVSVCVDSSVRLKQTDLVDVDTGESVSYQVTGSKGEITFKASNVPGLGYKVYEFRDVSMPAGLKKGVCVTGNSIENEFVRVKVGDNGFISSIFDKKNKEELVLTNSNYSFGQLVMSYGEKLEQGICFKVSEIKPVISKGLGGPIVGSLIITDPTAFMPRTEVILHDGSRSVTLKHTIDKANLPSIDLKYEVVYPLRVQNSRLLFDTPAGIFDHQKDGMPGWFPIVHVNRGGDITGDNNGVTIISKEPYFWEFGKMNNFWGGALPPDSSTLFMHLYSDARWGEYVEGHGEYILEPGAPAVRVYENTFILHDGKDNHTLDNITKSISEKATPLIAVPLARNPDGSLNEKKAQFFNISGDGIDILTLKKAENGDRYVLRLMERNGNSRKVKIDSKLLRIQSVQLLDNTEHIIKDIPVRKGSIEFTMKPREITTLRLKF